MKKILLILITMLIFTSCQPTNNGSGTSTETEAIPFTLEEAQYLYVNPIARSYMFYKSEITTTVDLIENNSLLSVFIQDMMYEPIYQDITTIDDETGYKYVSAEVFEEYVLVRFGENSDALRSESLYRYDEELNMYQVNDEYSGIARPVGIVSMEKEGEYILIHCVAEEFETLGGDIVEAETYYIRLHSPSGETYIIHSWGEE